MNRTPKPTPCIM